MEADLHKGPLGEDLGQDLGQDLRKDVRKDPPLLLHSFSTPPPLLLMLLQMAFEMLLQMFKIWAHFLDKFRTCVATCTQTY